MSISNINQHSINISQQEVYQKKGTKEAYGRVTTASITSSESVVYDKEDQEQATKFVTDKGYTVDMEKIKAMKEENELRMVELFRETVKGGSLKQIGGLRGYIKALRGALEDGDTTSISATLNITIEVTEETVAEAEADTADDGYWGAEQTSDRFLDFAKALSGDDPEKADMLMEAVEAGFKAAEEIWGSELPELSYRTLELTREKFEAWRDGTDVQESTEV